ncbi:hypothetical protein LJC59_05230 [Desulfovibrio sp. OttesenSCG-928-A18]|nr:hypothetical protein [Desulfovibrio sp. OttesenSCG-928-A18]
MQHSPFRLLPLILLSFLLAGCAVRSVIPPEAILDTDVRSAVRAHLRHGDWVVSRGIHGADNVVATATNAPLSHAAIYDAENNLFIESESQGVHCTALDDFFAKSHRIMVLRPMWATPQVASAAVIRAREVIGKGYNFAVFVGLSQPERYYCTQLVMYAYEPYIKEQPENPIPRVLKPGQMYHWARIIYDSGP